MSEAALLALLARSPSPSALARQVESALLFPLLRRLEGRGYLIRRAGAYRLTHRGRHELELARALRRATARALTA